MSNEINVEVQRAVKGVCLAKVESGYRKRLLDLSLRNRLLNWKASKRFTLSFRGLEILEAYSSLMDREGGKVEIIPVYDEEAYKSVGRRVPTRSGFLTDLAEKQLADKCLLTRREGDAVERDSGINHLHLVAGFLEWFDETNEARALRAPLILIPAKLVKTGNNRVTGIAEYAVEYDQTEVIINPCLVEKMKELSIKMPSFVSKDGDPPSTEELSEFLDAMEDIAGNRPGWSIVREIKVTFLSFAKLRMWRDLDPNQWPEDSALEQKHLLQALFGMASANEGADKIETGQSVQDDPKADAIPLVVMADSSQHQAIADVCRGLNIVIEGPPGTGKSQSITNILAALIAAGKSVLFVCEKFAALDVVKRNLEGVGLGAFCLELHGTKASKPAVYADLRKRLEQKFAFPAQLPSVRNDWKNARKTLNDYVTAASRQIGPRNEMYFEIVGKLERLRAREMNAPAALAARGKPCEKFSEREQFLTQIQQLLTERSLPRHHAWSRLDAHRLPSGHEDNLTQPLERVVQLLEFLLQCEAFVNSALSTKPELKLEHLIGLTAPKLAPFAISDAVDWVNKAALSKKANRNIVEKCRLEAGRITELETNTAAVLPASILPTLPEGLLAALKSSSDRGFYYKPLLGIPVETFKDLADELDGLRDVLGETTQLKLAKPTTSEEVAKLRQQLAVLGRLDPTIQGDLSDELFQHGLKAALSKTKANADGFVATRGELGSIFSVVGELPAASDVRKTREDIKINGASVFKRLLSKPYKEARQATYRWLILPSVYKYPGIVAQLEQLELLSSEEEAFNTDAANKRLGSLFKGVSTDWKRLESAIDWADQAMACGLTHDQVSMAKLDMHARLKKHAFEHALIATYSFSTSFFEDYALEMFKAFQDNGNVSVVLDDAIYQEILEKAVETKGAFPRGANLRYLLHPIRVPGVFHPKIIFLAGPKRGLLLIGSANFTQDGLSTNAEFVAAFDFEKDKDEVALSLFQSVLDFFESLEQMAPSEQLRSNLETIRAEVPWLSDERVSGGDEIPKFLHNLEAPLWPQLVEGLPGPVSHLRILSRFFDAKPSLLADIQSSLQPKQVTIYTQNAITTLSGAWIESEAFRKKQLSVRLCQYRDEEAYQDLHGKAYAFECGQRFILAMGSANFSTSALKRTAGSGNVEVLLAYPPASTRQISPDEIFDPAKTAIVLECANQLKTATDDNEEAASATRYLYKLIEAVVEQEAIKLTFEGGDVLPGMVLRFAQENSRPVFLNMEGGRENPASIPIPMSLENRVKAQPAILQLGTNAEGAWTPASDALLLSNLQELGTGRDLRRERQMREARESPQRFIDVLLALSQGDDDEKLLQFLTHCDIPLLLQTRLMRRSALRTTYSVPEGLHAFGARNLRHFEALHEAVINFAERHQRKLAAHVKQGTAKGIPNFLHIMLTVGRLVLSQVERLIAAFSAEDVIELKADRWHELRSHLDGYYRVLQSLLEVTALEYLDAIAEADPMEVIREGFDPALPDLEDLIRQAFAMRERIVELEGSRLIVDTGKGRVSGPGFFKSTVAPSNWITYRAHLESLKERIKSRLAA